MFNDDFMPKLPKKTGSGQDAGQQEPPFDPFFDDFPDHPAHEEPAYEPN